VLPQNIQIFGLLKQGYSQVFDSGSFSEDDTFLLTDWVAHIPKEVLAKNFKADISAFDHIPAKELYIFPSSPPPPINSDKVSDPQGTVPMPFSFALSKVSPTPLQGGSVKVVDSTTFGISQTIAAAEVTVEVGGMRELHVRSSSSDPSAFARLSDTVSSGILPKVKSFPRELKFSRSDPEITLPAEWSYFMLVEFPWSVSRVDGPYP